MSTQTGTAAAQPSPVLCSSRLATRALATSAAKAIRWAKRSLAVQKVGVTSAARLVGRILCARSPGIDLAAKDHHCIAERTA